MLFHKKDNFPYKEGLMQALMLVGYIVLVGVFFNNANRWFGNKPDNFLAPITFLTLFVVSALISSLIVFYKPYQLFIANKGKEALKLVIATVKWLVVALIVLMVILFLR